MRGRKPNRRNRALKRRAPLKNSKPLRTRKALVRKTPLRSKPVPDRTVTDPVRKPLRRKRKRAVVDDRLERLAFKRATVARAPRNAKGERVCPVCGRVPSASNPLQAHHVTAKATIKRVVASLGLDPLDAAVRLSALLWDARNGLPICEECHSAHTSAVRRIPRRFVTVGHRIFAKALGVEHLLDRYYPVE